LDPARGRSRRDALRGIARGHGVTDTERRTALEEIAAEVRVCTNCRLHQTRTKAVPGEGDPDTEVVFVGEGPGEHEDRQGRPFIGRSGEFLTELIQSIGWRRDEVFITNVVKCRPPGNRDPQPDEIEACSSYLRRQLEVLDPAVVVTAGKFSLASFRPGERISATHGTSRAVDPATGARNALAFAMYHPAFALYQASNRQTLIDDIRLLPAALIESRRLRDAAVSASVEHAPEALQPAPTAAAEPSSVTTVATPDPEPASSPTPAVDDATPQLTLF
jgi:uracil-DNA glycosylase family 4